MRWCFSLRCLPLALPLAAVLCLPPASPASERIKGVKPFDSNAETVEVFPAVEQGKLEVKLIANDSTQCRLLIRNKTDKPLNVTLPAAMAAAPVLAQFQPGNFDNAPTNVPQQLGIGNPFGNNWQGPQGNQMFNMPMRRNRLGPGQNPMFAPFNVAPEGVAQLRLPSVCLDPGKPDPRPAMAYQLKPIEAVTDKAEVHQLCRMLARGQLRQRAAQAAAWHLNNRMSWEALARLRIQVAMGRISRPLFTRRDLVEGKKAADAAGQLAKGRTKDDTVASWNSR